jgi:CMP-N-acetylneuraminic acid synthetase
MPSRFDARRAEMSDPDRPVTVLGLIPARGGSKAIPLKNIAPLDGRPLVSFTCEAALAARTLTRVIASTDNEDIASVVRKAGVEVPFLRPPELAQDHTPSIDVARHAVAWLDHEQHWRPDIVVLLQPTSPLRQAEHIDGAVRQLIAENIDTVVSVVPVPHNFLPWSLMALEGGRLVDFWKADLPFDRYRRQGQPTLFARNGPAVLVTRTKVLETRNSFYGESIGAYQMDERSSIDIDEPEDLAIAAALLRAGEI